MIATSLKLLALLHIGLAQAAGPGSWGPVEAWPVIPVGVFHLDDGRLLGFAAVQNDHFSTGGVPAENHNFTHASIWDPVTNSFENADLDGHDIFCPAMTFLPDGNVFMGGGGSSGNSYKVSLWNMATKSWERESDMNGGHWYGTGVATDNEVVVMQGDDQLISGSNDDNWIPEKSDGFDFSLPWTNLTDASFEGLINTNPAWYPQAHLLSNGEILISGTTNDMYVLDVSGNGTLTFAGKRNTVTEEQQAWGASTIMYKPGRILALGGIEGWTQQQNQPRTSLSRVIEIDARNPAAITTSFKSDMNFGRGFQNAVLGVDGKVYVFGGHQNGNQFDDDQSILTPEAWDPKTDTWELLTDMQTPRNYHASAILMQDGRIFVGGGGLCGNCPVNHQDHEIFTPPYMYKTDGVTLANRPVIASIPATAQNGETITIVMSGPKKTKIKTFMWMRFYSVTHSIATDQRGTVRGIRSGPTQEGGGEYSYTVKIPNNVNKFPRGLYWVYARSGSKVPSVGVKVQIV